MLDGGTGDDYLKLGGGEGNDVIHGGDGADRFSLWTYDARLAQTVRADGGSGNDDFEFYVPEHAMYGANDTAIVTGGAGSNTYRYYDGANNGGVTVTDFGSGVGGDRIDLASLLDYSAKEGRGYTGGNPMSAALGYVRVLQDGANTVLQYDRDGATGTLHAFRTVLTLAGASTASLTADNFVGGIRPDGGDVLGLTLTGTAGADTLAGGYFNDRIAGAAGADNISGGGGNDWLEGGDETSGGDTVRGGAGDDMIFGGAGADQLYGDAGNDNIDGGAGDDYLKVNGGEGSDVLDGGDGADRFSLWAYDAKAVQTIRAAGGNGNDQFEFYVSEHSMYGSNDSAHVTGGAGADSYKFYDGVNAGNVTILDFMAGAGGDKLDLATLLDYSAKDGRGYTGGNPMSAALGYARVVQDGANTVLQYDRDGAAGTAHAFRTVMTLQGASVASLTADNFVGGINPDGSDVVGLTLTGSAGNDTLTGGYFNDRVAGGAGADTISGGGGNDWLEGGDEAGSGDTIRGGSGNDTIFGGAGADQLHGDTGNDNVHGGAGDDYLKVNGGEGDDTLSGGDGADRFSLWAYDAKAAQTIRADGGSGDDAFEFYVPEHSMYGQNDTAIVAGGAGIDMYKFYDGANTGNVTVTDFVAGLGGDRIDVASFLDFSSRDGRGYTGGNPMLPHLAYLRLVQDGASTLVQYDRDGAAGSGDAFHTVLTLQNVAVEAINAHNFKPLTIEGGAASEALTGGLGVDTISGGGGNDVLDGDWGGDDMDGGDGDDTYHVDNLGDLVREVAGQGRDKVIAVIDYVMQGNVEDLQLGSGASKGTGNALDNDIKGNDKGNRLDGAGGNDRVQGGKGSDVLTGGEGLDIFVLSTDGRGGVDTVTDFTPGQDVILLLNGSVGASGALSAAAFALASSPISQDTRVMYDQNSGALYYDADGSGAGAAMQIATLVTGLPLTSGDFAFTAT